MTKKQKTQHTRKDYYLAYYWLIINVNPFAGDFCFDYTTDSDSTVVKEWKGEWKKTKEAREAYFEECYSPGGYKKDLKPPTFSVCGITYPTEDLISFEFNDCLEDSKYGGIPSVSLDMVDELFCYLHRQGIPYLHTQQDGEEIGSVTHVQRLWEKVGIAQRRRNNLGFDLKKEWRVKLESYLFIDHDRNLEKLSQAEDGMGRRSTAISPTYKWSIDREDGVVIYNTKSSKLGGILFAIFEELYDNEGKPIALNSLLKTTKKKLGYPASGRESIRDFIIDIKTKFVHDLGIDRDLMESIIKKHPSTGVIKSYTFHKNP